MTLRPLCVTDYFKKHELQYKGRYHVDNLLCAPGTSIICSSVPHSSIEWYAFYGEYQDMSGGRYLDLLTSSSSGFTSKDPIFYDPYDFGIKYITHAADTYYLYPKFILFQRDNTTQTWVHFFFLYNNENDYILLWFFCSHYKYKGDNTAQIRFDIINDVRFTHYKNKKWRSFITAPGYPVGGTDTYMPQIVRVPQNTKEPSLMYTTQKLFVDNSTNNFTYQIHSLSKSS